MDSQKRGWGEWRQQKDEVWSKEEVPYCYGLLCALQNSYVEVLAPSTLACHYTWR